MNLPHRPRWVRVEDTGRVVVERCAHTRVTFTDVPPEPAKPSPEILPKDDALMGIGAALVHAWPGLASDPDYVARLAMIALDVILPELGGLAG